MTGSKDLDACYLSIAKNKQDCIAKDIIITLAKPRDDPWLTTLSSQGCTTLTINNQKKCDLSIYETTKFYSFPLINGPAGCLHPLARDINFPFNAIMSLSFAPLFRWTSQCCVSIPSALRYKVARRYSKLSMHLSSC